MKNRPAGFKGVERGRGEGVGYRVKKGGPFGVSFGVPALRYPDTYGPGPRRIKVQRPW